MNHEAHLRWLATAFRKAAETARREQLDDYEDRAQGYEAQANRLEAAL